MANNVGMDCRFFGMDKAFICPLNPATNQKNQSCSKAKQRPSFAGRLPNVQNTIVRIVVGMRQVWFTGSLMCLTAVTLPISRGAMSAGMSCQTYFGNAIRATF